MTNKLWGLDKENYFAILVFILSILLSFLLGFIVFRYWQIEVCKPPMEVGDFKMFDKIEQEIRFNSH